MGIPRPSPGHRGPMSSRRVYPVAAFVVAWTRPVLVRVRLVVRSHPHPRTFPPLPCSGARPLRASTCGTLPLIWPLEHPADKARHRRTSAGGQRGSQVIEHRHRHGHVARGCASPVLRRMFGAPAPSQSPPSQGRFREAETRSAPLSANEGVSRFGSVSGPTYRQALTGLSWLSFSPSGAYPERRDSQYPGQARRRA